MCVCDVWGELVELWLGCVCDVWGRVGGIVTRMCVWCVGRVGGIVKRMFVCDVWGELVELWRGCVCDVWGELVELWRGCVCVCVCVCDVWGELVELWRRCVQSALNYEELTLILLTWRIWWALNKLSKSQTEINWAYVVFNTFQALLYNSASTVSRAGLFMMRQVKYALSARCGLGSEGHIQMSDIINSDWMGEFFQLQYSHLTLIRCVCVFVCVCVCVFQSIQRHRHVVQFVPKTAEHNIRSGTEQETCCRLQSNHHALSNYIIKALSTAIWQTDRHPPIDFKLSPCVKRNMFSFGCFPGVWVLISNSY
jgi:hypothetical protein